MTLDFEWFLCHAKQHSNVHPFLLSPRISYTPCLFFSSLSVYRFSVKFTCKLDVYYYIKHKWPAIFYFNKVFHWAKSTPSNFCLKNSEMFCAIFFILILCFCIDQYPLIEQHGFLLLVILLLLFSSLHNMLLYTILHVMCHCSTLRIV